MAGLSLNKPSTRQQIVDFMSYKIISFDAAHPVSLHNAIRETKQTGNSRTYPVPEVPRHDIPHQQMWSYKNPSAVFHIKRANSALLLGNVAFKSS